MPSLFLKFFSCHHIAMPLNDKNDTADVHLQEIAAEYNRLPARCVRCKYWEAGLNV